LKNDIYFDNFDKDFINKDINLKSFNIFFKLTKENNINEKYNKWISK